MFRATRWFALAVSFAVALHGTAFAQTRPKDNRSGSECADAGLVTVISSTVSGTSIGIANDLSFVLDEGDDLRVLPIIGKGAQQNLHDILQLKGSGANHSSANSSISSGIRTADLQEPETGFITVSASSSSRLAGSV